MKDLISVIIPVYNLEDYIGKCIESVLSQTYDKLEIIIVNDGSSDDSKKICESYLQKDKRIKLVNKENGGVSSARNTALSMATGTYIGFVDGDDYIEPDFFQTLYNIITQNGADISMVSFNRVKNDTITPPFVQKKEVNTLRIYDQFESLKFLFIDQEIQSHLWNKLFKAELFNGLSFPVGMLFEDVSIMYKIFKKINRLVYLKTPKYNYVFREASIMNHKDFSKNVNSVAVVVQNYHDAAEFPNLDQYRCYNLILWMIRNFFFSISDGATDLHFIEEQYELFKEAFTRHKAYITNELSPRDKVMLYAMLWDLNKAYNIVNAI